MIDLILQQDTWNEAQHSFQLSIPCPICSTPLARENTHHLTRCSSCEGLLEWTLHEGESRLYWPRTIGDNFLPSTDVGITIHHSLIMLS